MTEEQPNKKAELAQLLATGLSVPKAAAAAGVAPSTAYRWLESKEFQGTIDKDISNAVSNAHRRIAALTDVAVDALQDALAKSKPGSVAQMNAIKTVLEMASKTQHAVPVETEINFIEVTASDVDGKLSFSDPIPETEEPTNPQPK